MMSNNCQDRTSYWKIEISLLKMDPNMVLELDNKYIAPAQIHILVSMARTIVCSTSIPHLLVF